VSPTTIDILDNAGKATDFGICKLEGDTLFICSHSEDRPKEFATRTGDRRQLLRCGASLARLMPDSRRSWRK